MFMKSLGALVCACLLTFTLSASAQCDGHCPSALAYDYLCKAQWPADVILNPDEMPEPAFGLTSFHDYLLDNVKYPSKAVELGVEGLVFTAFIVEKDGSITNIRTLRGIKIFNDLQSEAAEECNQAIIKAIEKMPKCSPGYLWGSPVRTAVCLPVNFQIQQKF